MPLLPNRKYARRQVLQKLRDSASCCNLHDLPGLQGRVQEPKVLHVLRHHVRCAAQHGPSSGPS